jgi:hypothetical protein
MCRFVNRREREFVLQNMRGLDEFALTVLGENSQGTVENQCNFVRWLLNLRGIKHDLIAPPEFVEELCCAV